MKVVNIVPFLALVAGLNAREIKRQSGPVDPSTDPDCSYYDTSFSETDDCAYFEANWGISHSDFVAWVSQSYTFHPSNWNTNSSERIRWSNKIVAASWSAILTASK
jgi:hypothetical protein